MLLEGIWIRGNDLQNLKNLIVLINHIRGYDPRHIPTLVLHTLPDLPRLPESFIARIGSKGDEKAKE